jgi:hypothetical protein
MKVAMTGTSIDGGHIGDPETFSTEELDYARCQGAIIDTRWSSTKSRNYPVNVCGSCQEATGAFYVASHSPGHLEMVDGLAPGFVFQAFGTFCPHCQDQFGQVQ